MQTNNYLLPQQLVKKIVEKFVVIILFVKESMILLRGAKCNFIEQNC